MLKATKGHKVLIVALVLISIFATSLFVPEVSAVRTKQRQGRHEKDQAALLFDNFVRKHKKVYKDEAERTFRLGVFRKNLENLNYMKENSDQDVQYGITKFFDMSETEFKTKVLMRKQPNAVHPWKGSIPLKGKMEDVPSSWDWREHGAVTSVKNQGTVGTCWAFSAVGNIEGQVGIQEKALIDLSVEQITDCDGTMIPANNTGDCGVFGGWPFLAYEYVMNTGGLQSWKSYPYCMLDETCWPCAAPGYNATICGPAQPYCKKSDSCHFDSSKVAVKLKSWASLSNDEDVLMAQLYENGPVSIAIDATSLYVYWGGIVKGHLCTADKSNADHAVLLVGYGSQKNIFGEEVKYWIVKNSWGADWGEKGYFRLLRGMNTCGVANFPTTSILGPQE